MIAPFGIVGNAQETTTEVAVMLEKVGADGFEGATYHKISQLLFKNPGILTSIQCFKDDCDAWTARTHRSLSLDCKWIRGRRQ